MRVLVLNQYFIFVIFYFLPCLFHAIYKARLRLEKNQELLKQSNVGYYEGI